MTITASFPSVIPSLSLDFANSGVLDNRITFTRSTTGTYYNGYSSAVAEQNLLTYSEQFDNAAWLKSQTTATANSTTAPDGTTTADSFIENTATNSHQIYQTLSYASGASVTFSVYVKWISGTTRNIAISAQGTGGNTSYIIFDSTGAFVASGGTGTSTYTSTSVGSGWFRFTVTTTTTQTSGYTTIQLCSGTTLSYAGDGTSGVYIWGAQLEQRSSVTAYTPTTTTAITNYIPVLQTGAINQARFDHNPTTGESLGLLIEQQSTNLLTYSQAFDNAAWTKTSTTITTASNIAPDGTQTAESLVEAVSGTVAHWVGREGFTTTAGSNTLSVYAKLAQRTKFELIATGDNYGLGFDLSLGTTFAPTYASLTATGTMTSIGNGWYRCTITWTATAIVQGLRIVLNNGTTYNYAGNGYSGIYIWGAQLEALTFPTSYIPTVASQVTRSADSASMTGTNFSSWYNISQGTVYVEWAQSSILGSSNEWITTISDNTSSNYIALLSNPTNARGIVQKNGVSQSSIINGTLTANTFIKAIQSYNTNSFAVTSNGSAVSTTSSGSIPTVNQMFIGSFNSSNYLSGWIKKISYYPLQVSSANLIALTGS